MKNAAAILRPDVRTVGIRFPSPGAVRWVEDVNQIDTFYMPDEARAKLYTYVTDLPLKQGDIVLVAAAGEVKLAVVARVDDEVMIDPTDEMEYGWVIDVVDVARYKDTLVRNAAIELTVAEARRTSVRRTFAEQVTASLDDKSRDKLAGLLGVAP